MIEYAVLEITESCNLNCSHCYLGTKKKISANWETLLNAISSLEEIGCRRITFSGGEPFFEERLLKKCIVVAKQKGFNLAVVTNGTLLCYQDPAFLQEFDLIQVSLDGTESVHDSIRGIGTFEKVCNGIEYLISNGLSNKTSVQMTLSSNNMHVFAETYSLIKEYGVKMSIERVTAVGNAQDTPDFDFKQYVNILDCVVDNHLLSSDPLVNVRKFQRLKINPCGFPLQLGCSAGRTGLAITIHGDVLPCVRIRRSCGNINKTSLRSIINSTAFSKWAVAQGKCAKCQYMPICGGCKADFINKGNHQICYL